MSAAIKEWGEPLGNFTLQITELISLLIIDCNCIGIERIGWLPKQE